MGILAGSVSITRYLVKGKFDGPVLQIISEKLEKYKIKPIDGKPEQQSVGWTCFEEPYEPDFKNRSISYGRHLIFSLRIDKKSIPSKVVKKMYLEESQKILRENGRDFLSRAEKESLKEAIVQKLCITIPASPNIYDITWNIDQGWLWFFTNIKAANEALENLFGKTFNMSLIRIFPYTMALSTLKGKESKIDKLHILTNS